MASTSSGCLRATDRQNSSAAVSEAAAAYAASRELPRTRALTHSPTRSHTSGASYASGTSCISLVKRSSACSNSHTSWHTTPHSYHRSWYVAGSALWSSASFSRAALTSRRYNRHIAALATRSGGNGGSRRCASSEFWTDAAAASCPSRSARSGDSPASSARSRASKRASSARFTRSRLARSRSLLTTASRVASMSATASANACACILLSACTLTSVRSTSEGVFATKSSRVFSAVSKSPSSAYTCASSVATRGFAGSRSRTSTRWSSARRGSRISRKISACAQWLERPRPSTRAYGLGSFFSASP